MASYRLNKEIIDKFLKEKFGNYKFFVEVAAFYGDPKTAINADAAIVHER